MATAKGKRPQAGAKKTTSGRGPAKKKTGSRGGTSARRSDQQILSSAMIGVMVFGVSLLLTLTLLSKSNAPLILFLRSEINAWFGNMRFVWMLIVCVLGLQIAFGDRWPLRKASLFVFALLVFCVATLLQVFRIDDVFKMLSGTGHGITYNNFLWKSYEASKSAPYAGGLIGGLLGYPMGRYLDILGSALVLFFVIGGLLMLLIKLVVPGAGDSMSGWFGSILDDFGEWRQDRAVEQAAKRQAEADRRAQMQESEYDQALLVPVPKDLFEPDEEADEPSPRQKGAPVKGRPVSAPKAPKAPPVIAPRAQMQMEPLPMEPLYDIEMPTPKFAQKKEVRQTPEEAMQPPSEPPVLKKPRGRLYIEDILPEGAYSPMADAYTEEDVERFKQRTRSARKDPDAVPDFIAKRRAQYDEAYGAFESLSAQPAVAPADEEPLDVEMPEPEEETPFAEAPEPDMVRVDDVPWETIDDQYTPEEEPPRPVRRRRAHIENPLDYQPKLDPETRLDKPDWKPEPPPAVTAEVAEIDEYRQPPFSLLVNAEGKGSIDTRVQDAENAQKLEETLASFGVDARVIKVVHGPAVTRYELQPAPGVKVSKIVNLTDDIALNMAAIGVRIEAPIPGKAAIGIEIANDDIATVHLRDVLESEESIRNASKLAVALGKDIAGKRIIADLARMPHLLIAGATGSGKSVCINTIITSIIYRATPEEVRLILIDPKKVELAMYNGIPHLLVPVVTDPKKASGALSWAVMEMDERYKLFADVGVRDIKGYNAQRGEDTPLMPQIVVIIDELSDLMLVAPGEVEDYICRIAQLARACGIHLVIATQRPSVNVITGIIKANIPSRIAFAVSSQVDSRTILDTAGADKLLGKGDMLYAPSGGGKPMRVQGCFVSDKEVARVTEYVKDRHTTDYSQAVIDALSTTDDDAEDVGDDVDDGKDDPLFAQAVEIAVESGQASISMLQRRLRIGYARAGRIVDDMSRRNIISQADGAKPREVLITREDMQIMFKK